MSYTHAEHMRGFWLIEQSLLTSAPTIRSIHFTLLISAHTSAHTHTTIGANAHRHNRFPPRCNPRKHSAAAAGRPLVVFQQRVQRIMDAWQNCDTIASNGSSRGMDTEHTYSTHECVSGMTCLCLRHAHTLRPF